MNIAAHLAVASCEGAGFGDIERGECLVIALLPGEHAGEPEPRDVDEARVAVAFDDGAELGDRTLGVADEVVLRDQQSRLVEIRAARMVSRELRESAVGPRPVVVRDELPDLEIDRCRRFAAAVLPRLVLVVAEEAGEDDGDSAEEPGSVLLEPLLDLFDLFFF